MLYQIDEAMIARLKAMYRFTTAEYSGSGSSAIWTTISEKQKDIHAALLSDDNTLSTLLSDPGETYLYYGVDNIFPEMMKTRMSLIDQKGMAEHVRENLVILAEACGADRVWNPNGGNLFPNKEPKPHRNADSLLSDIEKILGTPLHFPSPFPNEVGLSSTRGLISYRAVHAVYQAYRLKQLTTGHGGCLEIGGGVGRTAYFANMLGIHNYTIVDLPMTLVGQAVFLAATLGPDAIWLAGEPAKKENESIRLLPPSFIAETSERFDVIINVDSFTEMDHNHAKEYADFALSHSNCIISINHESNYFKFRELIPSGITIFRYPYWLRAAYVEEVVNIYRLSILDILKRLSILDILKLKLKEIFF